MAKAFQQVMHGELPDGWDRDIPVFPADKKGMATRVAAGKVMNAVVPRVPALIGGSADLNSSPQSALEIDWANKLVNLDVDRQRVKDSPA